jgi:hypothetical protein
MRFEHEGMSLWYGTSDAPALDTIVHAGTEITITVGVWPVDAGNGVALLYRTNEGPRETVSARWLRNDPSGEAQYFGVRLPASAFRAGDEIEYTAICRCAGRQVPSAEEADRFASSFYVTAPGADMAPSAASERFPPLEPGVALSPPVDRPLFEPSEGSTIEEPLDGDGRIPRLPYGGSDKVAREFTGQLLNRETGAPLVGFTVRGVDLDAADEGPRETGYGITNARGLFSVVFNTPRDEAQDGPRRLRLHILDPQANEVEQAEVKAPVEEGRAVEVRLSASPADTQPLPDERGPAQERQSERDVLVSTVRIVPEDVTVPLERSVIFTAVPSDAMDEPVGGVGVVWRAYDADDQEVPISHQGEFAAILPGAFKVTAEAANKKAQTSVTVPELWRASTGAASLREVEPGEVEPVWDETNVMTAFESANRRGKDSVNDQLWRSLDPYSNRMPFDVLRKVAAVGSSNFQLKVPVVRLSGRGLDLALDLTYNSRLWHKAGNTISYDIDRGWPAPGWSLGFGKLVYVKKKDAKPWQSPWLGMLEDADGTRHPFSTVEEWVGHGVRPGTYWGHSSSRTTDGSLIDYTFEWFDDPQYTPYRGSGQAKYPDGTVVDFGAPSELVFEGVSELAVYPTRITDANGNYITIAYRNNEGPAIDTITDTLGRTIRFHYWEGNEFESLPRLAAITSHGVVGTTRTLVRLNYDSIAPSKVFKGLTPDERSGHLFSLIKAIYYPATSTGYWFGDPDSYSAYGMVRKVSEQRGMGFSAASLNEEGTITSGALSRQRTYNYPLTPDPSLTDAPAYTRMTETWQNIDTPDAVTDYSVDQQSGGPRRVSIYDPKGTRAVSLAYNAPGLPWKDGLVYQQEIYDAAGKRLGLTSAKWEQGDDYSPRLKRLEVTDELDQTTATEYSYGPTHNQVEEVRQYDYEGLLLRRVRTGYVTDPRYTQRHIFNLPEVVEVYNRWPEKTPASRTEYLYDGGTLESVWLAPGTTGHSLASDPYAPSTWVPEYCWEVCEEKIPVNGGPIECHQECAGGYWKTEYDPDTNYRGNVTQVKTYADAEHRTGAITETRRYDITGNLRATSTSPGEETRYDYTIGTWYAYPTAQTSGAVDPTYYWKRVSFSASYDFSTGLVKSTTDANGRTTQTTYCGTCSRPETVSFPTGATINYDYDAAALAITETTKDASGTIVGQRVVRFNGLGLVRRTETLAGGGERDSVGRRRDEIRRARPDLETDAALPDRSDSAVDRDFL